MFINKPLQKHYYILQINDKGEGFILRVSYLSHPAVRVKTMKEWTFDQNNFYSNQIRIYEIQMTMCS